MSRLAATGTQGIVAVSPDGSMVFVTGEGLGASHQTGWTGLVASLIDEWRRPPQPSSR